MISVLIRTKNEEEWIAHCLRAVSQQRGCEFEIVVMDNASSDRTVEIVQQFDCRLHTISEPEFSHGRALNRGIAAARGDLIAIISGHCIPANERWLARLAAPFADSQVAGVYGRQEPLPDSNDFDKRDLWTTFGLDRRVQVRDWFFHNANSMIRRDVWTRAPFDETLDGVEDRDWAKRTQEQGYVIVYEPRASVFHHHGIHQGRDEKRARRVARVIELIRDGKPNE